MNEEIKHPDVFVTLTEIPAYGLGAGVPLTVGLTIEEARRKIGAVIKYIPESRVQELEAKLAKSNKLAERVLARLQNAYEVIREENIAEEEDYENELDFMDDAQIELDSLTPGMICNPVAGRLVNIKKTVEEKTNDQA